MGRGEAHIRVCVWRALGGGQQSSCLVSGIKIQPGAHSAISALSHAGRIFPSLLPIPPRTASHKKKIPQSFEHQTPCRASVNTLGPPRAQHVPLICIFTKRPAATRGHQTNPSPKPHQYVLAALTRATHHTRDQQTQ